MAQVDEGTGSHGVMTPGRTRVLMILVVILTAVAIWLVPVDKQESPPTHPSLPSEPGKVEKLPLPSPENTVPDQALPSTDTGISAVINGGDSARDFLARQRAGGNEPDNELVFTEAEQRQDEGRLEDAYLLYRYAARHGNARAAFILGTQADPAFHDTAGGYLPDPDTAQAFKWYSLAAEAGDKEAGPRLESLHARLLQEAKDGNAQARRLLLQWP